MRVTFLLKLVLFITTAWASGYQGVLERVLLYYAYEIDGLNPPGERIIGFACDGGLDRATGRCRGAWIEANPGGPRANINQLLAPLSRLRATDPPFGRDGRGNPLPLANGINGLDPQETAKYLYQQITRATRGPRYPQGIIPNPPPSKMMRYSTDNYVKFLSDVGIMVQETSKKGTNYVHHRDLFKGFEKVNTLVLDARIGEHGEFQIRGIEARLQGTGITVQKKPVGGGTNPATGATWEAVDWRQTITDGVTDTGKTQEEVARIVQRAAADFYTSDNVAKNHKEVIDSTRRTDQRMKYCGP